MITYRLFDTLDTYVDAVVNLISSLEGHLRTISDIGDGAATIGYGYTFNRSNNLALWTAAGIALTDAERAVLENIDSAPADQKTTIALTQWTRVITLDEAQQLLRQMYSQYEGPANDLSMPLSVERVALVSITYNRGETAVRSKMDSFYAAVQAGDRAEAWYQIRYNAQTANPVFVNGIANRRYKESDYFGLYNASATVNDYKDAYRMYTRHSSTPIVAGGVAYNGILDYEARFSPSSGASIGITTQLTPAHAYLLQHFVTDQGLDVSITWDHIYVGEHDGSDGGLDTRYYRNTDADTLTTTEKNDLIFAESGNDDITAGAGDDILYGGTGNDLLKGGTGHDYYLFKAGDGLDVIDDEDGLGEIRLYEDQQPGSRKLDNGKKFVGPDGSTNGIFVSDDGLTYFVRYNDMLTLVDSPDANPDTDGGIVIRHYAAGDLDIALDVNRPTPVYWNFFSGDQDPDNLKDTLNGTDENDIIYGYTDEDILNGHYGDDLIYGGAGNDRITGDTSDTGGGNDTLYGEGGDDVMWGDAGSDFLDGGTGADIMYGDWTDSDYGHDTLLGGDGNYNDLLAGMAGFDWLDGGDGSDILSGGAGQDFIYGGAGSDFIYGDATYEINAIDNITGNAWSVNVTPADNKGISYSFQYVNLFGWVESYLDQKADFIDGGAGNDFIWGHGGNDVINGGADNDWIQGGAGNDYLEGGAGDDVLIDISGDDIYVVSPGEQPGHDKIVDSNGNDSVIFRNSLQPAVTTSSLTTAAAAAASTVTAADITVYRTLDDDLLVDYGSGSLTFVGWYGDVNSRIETVEFTNGSTLTGSQLSTRGMTDDHQYTFDLGQGELSIKDWGGNDTLTFGAGILPEEITTEKSNQDLILRHSNGTDFVRLIDWFYDKTNVIEQVLFADDPNVVWRPQALTSPFLIQYGTDSNDTLYGTNAYADELYGYGGDDLLSGAGGNDLLVGGTGNDFLYGDEGADLYVYNLGDGDDIMSDIGTNNYNVIDTLRFGTGLSRDDFGFEALVGAVKYTFAGTSGSVTVYNPGNLENIQFTEEGTSRDDVIAAQRTGESSSISYVIYGYDGNDTLYGGAGIDTLVGGAGDDTLGGTSNTDDYIARRTSTNMGNIYEGGTGDDLLRGTYNADFYRFGIGDGHDTIDEQHPSLDAGAQGGVIEFGEGITQDTISITKVNGDILITVSPTDSITVRNWFSGIEYQQAINFYDGTSMSRDDIQRAAMTITGTSGDDVLTGTDAYDEVLLGLGGNDMLSGLGGNDTLDGGADDDVVYGGSGNDLIIGGQGADRLEGGSGDDTYQFAYGHGIDTIYDYAGSDRIEFGVGISAGDVSYHRDLNNLVLTLHDSNGLSTGDQLTIENFLVPPDSYNYEIEQFVFTDGSALPDNAVIKDGLLNMYGQDLIDDQLAGTDGVDYIYGLGGNDTLSGAGDDDELFGGQGNDVLHGGAGRDLLYGEEGDDTLWGGAGVDYLSGGAGNDSYRYELADGGSYDDTIEDTGGVNGVVYGTGITPQGVSIVVSWTGGTTHSLNVTGFTIGDGLNGVIQTYSFADGSVLTQDELLQQYVQANGPLIHTSAAQYSSATMQGTAYDDDMTAGRVNDVLDGGAGNDLLRGESGDDTYIFGRGYGTDTIIESGAGANDTVDLGSDIARADVDIHQSGKDLELHIKETSDTLVVQNFFTADSQYQVENMVFGDGFTIGLAGLEAGDVRGTTKNDTLRGSRNADRLYGDAGNDTLLGKDGNDTLDGGTGNDTLDGNGGDDVYLFSAAWGQDTLIESAGADEAAFGSGVTALDLVFRQNGSDLVLERYGSTDSVTVQNWYGGDAYQVETFRAADGSLLADTQVDQLIQAMATFSTENGGISWEQAIAERPDEVQAVLAQYWQTSAA